jgi:protein-S-isoprenylcysteine O-methyltransferase Ste14
MVETTGAAASLAPPAARPSLARSFIRYSITALLLAGPLFLISGRLNWLRAWIFIVMTLGTQVIVGTVLHRKRPELLVERSRLQRGTKSWDKILAPLIAIIGPVAIWCIAAWDIRTQWPPPIDPLWSAVAIVLCVLGSAFVFWAMLSNPFFATTVRIQSERNQVVVDRGPYRYVRHPGYSGALLFTLASPVVLGSVKAIIPAVLTCAVLALRTGLEDATLRAELNGYAEYSRRVRSRLVPGAW